MSMYFVLSIHFLDPTPSFHGRSDGGEPEWPPSPLRLFQSLLAGAAARWNGPRFAEIAVPAIKWLEGRASEVIAPPTRMSRSPYRMYVPNNAGDLVVAAWARGMPDASIAEHRVEKDVRPMWLQTDEEDQAAVHYLFPLNDNNCPYLATLTTAARSITHLGWGVDMVAGNAAILSEREVAELPGEHWRPSDDLGKVAIRIPIIGTLDALIAKHKAFLNRICRDVHGNESFNPVPPLSAFRVVGYRRATDPPTRPSIVFELRKDDDTRFNYPQARFIHLAGMVRHLAIELMKRSPPEEIDNPGEWVRTYVAGHCDPGVEEHRQFSYLPLPSIGFVHTDPAVRRVMVAAPLGDDRLLEHLAKLLSGQQLQPTPETKLDCPPTLVRVRHDKVAKYYTEPAANWASVTPVILPGHDDHKPDKTRKLIAAALRQSGVEQPCEYDWSAFSHFPKSLSAHKYDRDKRPTGYIRPHHLLSQTAVHLTLRFRDGVKVPGPLAIGAGRHCGFGLFAHSDANDARR
jgi:CRISPR-associated protein Csb2